MEKGELGEFRGKKGLEQEKGQRVVRNEIERKVKSDCFVAAAK